MSVKYLYLIAVAAILGCAPASSRPGTSAVHRNPKLLTAGEITDAHADNTTAYDAISRLRPNWLVAHGEASFITGASPFATIWVDGQRYGDLSVLHTIPASQVAAIRYYDVTEAGAKFGVRAGVGGVIEVITALK